MDHTSAHRNVPSETAGRVALVFRGDRRVPIGSLAGTRLGPVVDALAEVGLSAQAAAYSDDAADEVRAQLTGVDGVLVWVDPVTGTDDRTTLDAVLRDVAAAGVWVSAHPDTIQKMGTKEVIYRTRELGWGSETYLYRTFAQFVAEFPQRLEAGGARVLKQFRGNGGIGVQKVQLVRRGSAPSDAVVRVQSARLRDEVIDDVPLDAFLQRCSKYFGFSGGAGRLIDQAFEPRIAEGIIRCYLVEREVVGFARQYPHASSPSGDPAAARHIFGLPADKTMYPPDEPALQRLRDKVEAEWVPAMQQLVGVDDAALPALWDADFLLGPADEAGDDTYVLCEINVSSVLPFPPHAPAKLAAAALEAVHASKASRQPRSRTSRDDRR